MMKERFTVIQRGKCKHVYIPKDYCTVYMQGRSIHDTEIDMVGDDVCIQNISAENKCQNH